MILSLFSGNIDSFKIVIFCSILFNGLFLLYIFWFKLILAIFMFPIGVSSIFPCIPFILFVCVTILLLFGILNSLYV